MTLSKGCTESAPQPQFGIELTDLAKWGRGDTPDSAGPAMHAKCGSDVKWHTYTEIIYFSCPITCKS